MQGKTSFPQLEGKWDAQKSELVAIGFGPSGDDSITWFKLKYGSKGELVGVRRFMSNDGSASGCVCFADYDLVAKKQ